MKSTDSPRLGGSESPTASGSSIYPTLAELVRLPVFAAARLLTAESATQRRRVRHTSVQEIPLDDFVRRDELVMTTGIGLGGGDTSLVQLIRDVADAGAAGLAIAVGPYIQQVPAAATAEANRLGLPLLELPWVLRFGEIAEAFLNLVVDRQNELLRRSDQMQQLFTRIVLEGRELAHVCQVAESILPCLVRVVDRWGEVTDGGPGSRAQEIPCDWDEKALQFAIKGGGRVLGTLQVVAPGAQLSDLDAIVASHAVTASALIMLREQAAADSLAREQSELLVAALSESGSPSPEIARRAIALGFDPRQKYMVVHLGVSSASLSNDQRDVAQWALHRALNSRRITALEAWEGSDVTLIVPVSGASGAPSIRGLVADMAAYARRQDPDSVVSCGIGRLIEKLDGLRLGVQDATAAMRIGRALHGPGTVTAYEDLGAYVALGEAIASKDTAAVFCELEDRYLGALLAYESKTGLPLVETISQFFWHRGNASATSRALGLNRQSLLYRLERIKDISGVDLDSPMDRFAFELAIQCWLLRRLVDPTVNEGPARLLSHVR